MAFVTGRVWRGTEPPPTEIALTYQLIGQIASNWVEVEGLWYLIFTCLMRETPRQQADAKFFKLGTSALQRDLVMRVAEAVYPKTDGGVPHPMIEKLGQLNARSRDLAGFRNAAIHGRLLEAYEDHTMAKLTPRMAPGGNAKRSNRLAGKDLIAELQKVLNELCGLISELEAFLDTISPRLKIEQELQQAIDKLRSAITD
jgi:hypothetical protein